jgi:hypothetical protein
VVVAVAVALELESVVEDGGARRPLSSQAPRSIFKQIQGFLILGMELACFTVLFFSVPGIIFARSGWLGGQMAGFSCLLGPS